jgi:hypothetical protein
MLDSLQLSYEQRRSSLKGHLLGSIIGVQLGHVFRVPFFVLFLRCTNKKRRKFKDARSKCKKPVHQVMVTI